MARRRNPRPVVWLILSLGLAAAVMVFLASRTTIARTAISQVGWALKSRGVILLPGQARFMDRMRAAHPGLPLTVTSGYRGPAEQASALMGKLRAGASLDSLRKLYGGSPAITELLRYPPAQWPSVLATQASKGIYLSRHMRQDAVDLRVHDGQGQTFPAATITAMISAAKAAGARKAFYEPNPEHFHIEGGMA